MAMTGCVTFVIAVYAMTTKQDFSRCTGLMYSYACSFILYGLMTAIWGFNLGSFFALLLLILSALYMIMNIQTMSSGKRDDINKDDYVLGAIVIYMDILTIFLGILRLCKCCKN